MFDEGEKQYKEALEAHSRLNSKLEPSTMNAYSRPSCLADTQVAVRGRISNWLASEWERPVLWLHGVAGSGKSTIVNTIAQELDKTRQLGAYLFFERAKSKPEKVVHTLAYQLAKSNAVIAKHVEDRTIGNTVEHFSSFKELIIDPLKAADSYVEGPIVIILDALDECGQPSERKQLLDVLTENFSELPTKFRILITSRPERDLLNALLEHDLVRAIKLNHAAKTSRDDVSKYFAHEMGELFKPDDMRLQVPTEWPWDTNVERLGEAANGLFIWASTAVKYVSSGEDIAFRRLDKLVADVRSENFMGFGIDKLYIAVLDSIRLSWEDDDSRLRFSRIMYLVLTVDVRLSADDIDAILGLSSQTSSRLILSRLQSVLMYKSDSRSRIRLLHASFSDFLTSDKHSDAKWFVDIHRNEEYITERCLGSFDIMDRLLRFNICGVKSSFKMNADEGQLTCSVDNLRIQPRTDIFLEKLSRLLHNHLLFWLEVLSLIGKGDEASAILLDAIRWISGSHSLLEPFLRDAQELVSTFSAAISKSVPHIYLSMIPLARKESRMASHYSQFIIPTTEVDITGERPDASSRKYLRESFEDYHSVSYSRDGRYIVAGSGFTVRIWDAESNDAVVGPLFGHTDTISSVTFSPDGERVVSGSMDKTIRVWDVERAETTLIIKGHTDKVNSVAFSPDGRLIVSGSDDQTLRVWDAMNGKSVYDPIEEHESAVRSVSFSPDGRHIASSEDDKTVRVWDARSGKSVRKAFTGHTKAVNSIAYSPDGKHIVSGSSDETILVWEVENGQIVTGPLKEHEGAIVSVAYSPNGKYIVSGSNRGRSQVWAVHGGEVVPYTVRRHRIPILSVAFSPDNKRVASSTIPGGIEIWDIERGNGDFSSFKGHNGPITSVAFLPDNMRVVSGSMDCSIVVWDTKSGKLVLGPLKGHTRSIKSVASSPDGKYILSGSDDATIRVWSAETGEHVRTMEGDGSSIDCVSVSRDGKRVVAGSHNGSVCIWDMETGDLSLLKGHTDFIISICLSPDGNLVASCSCDKTIILWSAQSGSIVAGLFKGHASGFRAIVFSPDGKRILSSSWDNMIRVWDVETGQLTDASYKAQADVYSLSLSPDGKRFASGADGGTITLWDAEDGGTISGPFKAHTSTISSIAYSSDGKYLVSGSYDDTINVWDAENEIALSEGNAYLNWTLSKDGWILGQDGELLMWLPYHMRRETWHPRNTAIFNTRFIMRLRYMKRGIVESWEECFDQKALTIRKENNPE